MTSRASKRGRRVKAPVLGTVLLMSALFPAPAPAGERCTGGRYLVEGTPLVRPAGSAVVGQDVLVLAGSEITIESLCGPTRARLRKNRKGFRLRARWLACPGFVGPVRLRGRINRECTAIRGRLRARRSGLKRRFVAGLSRCGDGIRDAAAGEECDDGNLMPGDGCEADCAVVRRSVTATLAGASVLGSILEEAVVTVTLGGTRGEMLFSVRAVSPTFQLCTWKWHVIQDNRQIDFAATPDPARNLAHVTYEEFDGCGALAAGVTVGGRFSELPAWFDLAGTFRIRYDFGALLGTCRNERSVCEILVE